MKKFERQAPETRKKEIKEAAAGLFVEKGFLKTTMEDIVERISLSKGGLYRLYPSSSAILSDIIIDGMRVRNAFYVERVEQELSQGRPFTLETMTTMICDSLLLKPDISTLYVEFLIAKKRIPELENLYKEICKISSEETMELIKNHELDKFIPEIHGLFDLLTELMNTAILGLCILNLKKTFEENKQFISSFMADLLSKVKLDKYPSV